MKGPFEAVKVSEHVYWVGALDWTVRDFHGYLTSRGTTYNAFLVMAEKITLIDTVKKPYRDELLSRIASVIDPRRIEVIVSNHAEMDHSGCLFEVADIVGAESIYASTMGVKALQAHFDGAREVTAVPDGESIGLGNMELQVFETRMVHWPDSMFSYLSEDKILFPQDGFGMHLASTERFDDQIPTEILCEESAKYFANILLPFASILDKALAKFLGLGLDVKIIAPDHGPIWRKNVGLPIKLYTNWVAQKPTGKVAVVFDTMWDSTAAMAKAVTEGLTASGARAKVMPLNVSHRSDVATEILEAGGLIVGSPTINGNLFPTLADCLSYLKGLKRKNLVGAAFGSYGWSGEGVKQIEEILDQMKVERVADSVKVQYVPKESDLQACRKLGEAVGNKVMAGAVKAK